MLDSMERLRNNPELLELFNHYANLGETNPEAWQLRLMQIENDGRADLVKLHGQLIAFDWIEQNTGQMPCSYRLTRAGLKALREIAKLTNDESGTVEIENRAA